MTTLSTVKRGAGLTIADAGVRRAAGSARPTMRDVAEAAGVSLKTVSRVVNAEPGVGAGTSARVQQAISSLGFSRNDLARSLRHGRTSDTVGLVIGDLANPFYSAIARAAEQVASAHGHLLITGSSERDADRERELVRALSMRRVDGLLLVPSGEDHAFLAAEQRLGLPVVFLDRPPHALAADAVLLDNAAGARAAVAHLITHGHRRIGVVGDPLSVPTSAERRDGHRAALAQAGLADDPALLRFGPSEAAGAEAAARELLALPDPPTAFFTTNNRNTIGVLRAIRDAPRAKAIVGFDDFELADALATPVTVVAHDPAEMGRAGAELLFARLAGDTAPPVRLRLPTALIPRGSGEIPP